MEEKEFGYTVSPWERIEERKEYDTPIFSVLKTRAQHRKDEEMKGDFYVIDAPDWVNVIPTTEDEEVILVEQYRHGIEAPTLEIPGGVTDKGEEPINAVKRELKEETGYESTDWHRLGKVSTNPAIFNNRTYLYWAENCRKIDVQNLDDHEFIKVHAIPLDEFLDLVHDGTVHHTLVVASVAKFLLYRERSGRGT